jgi:TfoX/Sxy family transcriptional regulator of competence genes
VRKGAKRKQNKPEKTQIDLGFDPVVQAFKGIKGVKAGKLFSSFGLKVNGKIFAMFGRGRLVVKLPKERVDALVSTGKAERFDPGHGRLMKEWATFESGDAEWVELAREAWDFVRQGKQ